MIIAVVAIYLGLVIVVGTLGHRLFRNTAEDYFVASRSIGSVVLLMTLLGTNLTAFTMLGASGEAYRLGIVVFGLMGASSSILIPFLFYYLGTKSWWLGKRFSYVTQIQMIRDRYTSPALGTLLFVVVVLLMLPYILIGVKGGGDALAAITHGEWPSWAGSLLVCGVTFLYVTYGGMRSTAWVNTFQTTVFILVGIIAYLVIMDHYGGIGEAMITLRDTHPEFVVFGSGSYTVFKMLSYLLLPISVAAFPHIYGHWLSARTARSFQTPIVFYPLCIAAVWVPSVTLGMVGRIDFTAPLNGPILIELILAHTGGVLAGCLAAGVFAAIMSSLDSQILALGAMFTEDIVRFYGFDDQLSEKQQILFGRLFVTAFLVLAFIASLFTTRSIFELGTWSLTGFAGLVPVFVGALYWKRSTKQGATAAILSVIGLWLFFYADSLNVEGAYSIGGTGLIPAGIIVPVSALLLILVSFVTTPPRDADRFF